MGFTDELLYGKEFENKKKLFEEKLIEIEDKHSEWFSNREDTRDITNHDRLHWHYLFGFEPGMTRFNFIPESELPLYIREECFSAFYEIFPK